LASPLDSAPLDEDGLPLPGATLGAYVLEHRLGQGGMAAVFAGRHKALGKRVAIKMLLPHNAARADIARRFVREGEAAARLDHPHVVGVSDVGSDARGAPFLVMEYLEGQDLAALLKQKGRLDIAQIADLLVPVMSAVAAAHDAGIVHRDLKPQNIFLARERNEVVPKVLDFGISKLMEGDSLALTGTGTILGTPYYISPEQAQGARKIDARTDQFSLGVIMYECVTGRRPFEGKSLYSVIASIVSSEPAPPRELVIPLEPKFEAIVNRALQKQPGARYSDVRALGRELLPFASFRTRLSHESEFGLGEASEPAPTPARGARARIAWALSSLPSRQRTRPLLLAVGLLLAALTVAVALAARSPTAKTSRRSAPPPMPEVRAGAPAPPAPTPLPAAPPASASYRVTLSARPATAVFWLDGAQASQGSLTRELPVDGVEHVLEAALPGYRTTTLRFRDAPPAESLLVLELERLPVAKRQRPSTATAPPGVSRSPAPPPAAEPPTSAAHLGPQRGANQAAIVR